MEIKLNAKSLLKTVPLLLLVLVLSFIVGDEVSNRLQRREYRERCIEMHVQGMGLEALPLIEMKCYQLLP